MKIIDPTPAFLIPYNGDAAWRQMTEMVFENGMQSAPRGKPITEVLATTATIAMSAPVVLNRRRKLSYRFMAAEAWWIGTGRSDVASIAPYNKHIASFSDDGETFFGAYGPKAIPQMEYVVDKLVEDPDSRQAVINIWRESPTKTKDVPCTTTVQWFIRQGKLYCMDNMRSNDIWLGFPYDIFNFSMLSAALALRLRARGVNVELGHLYLRAGSSHIYEPNFEAAKECLNDHEPAFSYKPLNLDEFKDDTALWNHLKLLADKRFTEMQHQWLSELFDHYASKN
jgi:thymidylate synthase